ncbi:MAG: class I SAM-dependent methyltransferase [Nostocoides sp.]
MAHELARDHLRVRPPGVADGVRTAAVWTAVAEVAARRSAALGRPLRVIDLGGGTGGLAVPLAAEGHEVLVVDPSPDALAALRRRAADVGVSEHVTARQGDAETLAEVLAHDDGPVGRYAEAGVDLVCCHGTLEVVEDLDAAVAGIAAVLAGDGVLSLVTAQRLAAVLARALAGRIDQAAALLANPDGRWGEGDPIPRRFDPATLTALLARHGLEVIDLHGVRVVSDLVPSTRLATEQDRRAVLDLEEALAAHPDAEVLGRLGAAVHILAGRARPVRPG